MRMIARHRIPMALFAVYWLVAMSLSIQQLLRDPGQTPEFTNALQVLAPVLAGGLIAFSGGWIAAGIACGAALGILDFGLLLNMYLHSIPPSDPNYPGVVGTLVPILVPGVIGGMLGLGGALAGRFLGAKREKNRFPFALRRLPL
jgi:hypothetical protein